MRGSVLAAIAVLACTPAVDAVPPGPSAASHRRPQSRVLDPDCLSEPMVFFVAYDRVLRETGAPLRFFGAGNRPPAVGARFVVLDDVGYVGEFQVDRVQRRGLNDPLHAPGWVATASWESRPRIDGGSPLVAIAPRTRPVRWGRVLEPSSATETVHFATPGSWATVLVVDLDADSSPDLELRAFGCSDERPTHASPPVRLVLRDGPRERAVPYDSGWCPAEAFEAEYEVCSGRARD